jgi:predicted nucleic acid-binding protein
VNGIAVNETFVLDSYAILALLGGETSGEVVADLLRQAGEEKIPLLMTWINVGEVAYIVERRWGKSRMYETVATLEETEIEIVPVGRELALAAASVKAGQALAYADAFAAALALTRNATLVTGDPEFRALEPQLTVRWLE